MLSDCAIERSNGLVLYANNKCSRMLEISNAKHRSFHGFIPDCLLAQFKTQTTRDPSELSSEYGSNFIDNRGNSERTELFFETTARSSDDWTRWGRVIKRGGGVRAEERVNDRAIEKEEGGRERPDTLALSSIISYCLLRHLI